MNIPPGWADVPFESITPPDAPIIYGILQPGPQQPDGIAYVRPSEIGEHGIVLSDLRKTTRSIAKKYSRSALKANDIILTIVGTIGKVASVPSELEGGNITQSSCRIRPDGSVIFSGFLKYFLRSDGAVEQYNDKRLGTAVPRLNIADIRAFRIRLPPLAEQRRIVSKLDALTARLARARAELDRVLVLARLMRERIYRRIDSGDRSGDLGSLLQIPIRNGLSIKGSDHPPGVAALRLSALRSGAVDLSDVRYLPISIDRAAAYELQDNDLLVSRGNGTLSFVGIAAIVPALMSGQLTIFPDTAFRIRVDTMKADPRWLMHVWNSPIVRTQIARKARTTAGIWKISQGDLREIRLPTLPLDEQKTQSREIDTAFARAARLEAETARAKSLLDCLESALLAKAFRGELVPQDANDEPASALLSRIRATRTAQPKPKRGRTPQAPSTTRVPRKKAAMTKSRSDDAVKDKPYLAGLLRAAGGKANAETLFKYAELPIADFYKQLAWEVDAGHIKDNAQVLEAT